MKKFLLSIFDSFAGFVSQIANVVEL